MNPSQFYKIAKYLNMSVEETFKKYFALDWWVNYKDKDNPDSWGMNAYLIAPAIKGCEGGLYPGVPNGTCSLLDVNNKCMIHPVKPKECAESFHGTISYKEAHRRRLQMVTRWQSKRAKALIVKVLGHEP
jgi:Fe-S-cluster containining protein